MTVLTPRRRAAHQQHGRIGAVGAVLFIAIASVLIASKAHARPDVRQMSCQQVNATIAQSGSVVLSITNTRYSRFVASTSYCDFNERARQTYEATADTPRCRIRYICEQIIPAFGFN